MKKSHCLCLGILVLSLASASGQPGPGLQPPARNIPLASQPQLSLTKFDLDYPGGIPGTLVEAIEKATDRRLNVIIRDELANTPMPPLKMKNVDVVQLFQALEMASMKTENYITGTYFGGINGQASSQYQQGTSSFGFKTQGPPTDDSIWYFVVNRPPKPPSNDPPKACRFYSLAPYLESGLTVEDITTAIQTGWKMMGYTTNERGLGGGAAPTISFHKETKLLIAVGEPEKLETIDAVLKALRPENKPQKATVEAGNTGAPKPAKTEK